MKAKFNSMCAHTPIRMTIYSLVILLGISIMGCSTIKSYSNNADGHYVIPRTINIAGNIPEKLKPYVPRFKDILMYHGFYVGHNDDSNAAQLSFELVDEPTYKKIAVSLTQNGLPIVTAESFPRHAVTEANKEIINIPALVEDAANAFDGQLSDFSKQIRIIPDNVGQPSLGDGTGTEISFGTAFAVDSLNTFVTARHVVKDAKVSIKLRCPGGQTGDAHVTAIDIYNDLVVLNSNVKAQAFLRLAPDSSVSLGDQVFTVGFPVPTLLGLEPKYSNGSISSLAGIEDTKSLMQITIPIQPGNSGGAVVNTAGQVVGVVISTAAIPYFAQYTGTLPQNINYAVRSYYLRPLLSSSIPKPDEAFRKLTGIERTTASTCLVEAR